MARVQSDFVKILNESIVLPVFINLYTASKLIITAADLNEMSSYVIDYAWTLFSIILWSLCDSAEKHYKLLNLSISLNLFCCWTICRKSPRKIEDRSFFRMADTMAFEKMIARPFANPFQDLRVSKFSCVAWCLAWMSPKMIVRANISLSQTRRLEVRQLKQFHVMKGTQRLVLRYTCVAMSWGEWGLISASSSITLSR